MEEMIVDKMRLMVMTKMKTAMEEMIVDNMRLMVMTMMKTAMEESVTQAAVKKTPAAE